MGNDNYYQVQGWMLNEFGLKSNELIIYAIIYGMSQGQEGEFYGSYAYLMNATGLKRSAIILKINSLLAKGYIIKLDKSEPGKAQHYQAIGREGKPVQKVNQSKKQTTTHSNFDSTHSINESPTHSNFEPNNNSSYNKEDNNKSYKKEYKEHTHEPEIFDTMSSEKFIEILTTEEKEKKVAPKKEKFGEHENVLLTEDECRKLSAKYSNDDLRWIIEKLSNFKLSKGKTYKSDYGAINAWVIEALTDHKKKNNGSSKGGGENSGNAFTRLAEEIRNGVHFGGS